jgi:alkylated DNA repair dioxygenase AlkB
MLRMACGAARIGGRRLVPLRVDRATTNGLFFSRVDDRGREALGEGAWVAHRPGWLPRSDAAGLFEKLRDSLPWSQGRVRVWNAEHLQPRLTAWHGDPACVYDYSGLRLEPAPWTPELGELRSRLEAGLGCAFNSVLANLYRDGQDCVGWHADAEPCFGRDEVIVASLSLGSPRRFLLRHRATQETREWSLGEGDLLVMGGATQRHWRHSVPRTSRSVGPRINLTFRRFLLPA